MIDLLELARYNKTVYEAVYNAFNRELASKTIVFYSPHSKQLDFVSNSSYLINDFNLFTSVLHTFGDLITELEIRYDEISEDQRRKLHNLLRKYCTNSQLSLRMSQCDSDVLYTFHHRLPNVKQLIISGDVSLKPVFIRGFILYRDAMSLSSIFPKIQSLTIVNMMMNDPSILEHTFPRLTDVQIILYPAPFVNSYKNYFANTKPAMENLFDHNPQIRSLTLNNCNSIEYLKIAADRLPELEYLNVDFVDLKETFSGEKIIFENVKTLDMTMETFIDIDQFVAFPQLKQSNLECESNDCPQ